MLSFMADRLWRAVWMVFSGRVNIVFTHACTIKNSSSYIVFESSLVHLYWPGALPGFRLLYVPRPVLHASILSFVISSTAAIVHLLCRKFVKCQHPWQKTTSSHLLCSAASCGMLAQVLLTLLQFVIVGSGRHHCAPTQPSGEGH